MVQAYVSSSKLSHNNLRFTKVSTTVDADIETVAALTFLSGNRKNLEAFYNSPNGLEMKIWKLKEHCHVHYRAHHFGNIGLSDREIFLRQMWKRTSKREIQVGQVPCEPDEMTPVEDLNTGQHVGNRVRALFYALSTFEELEPVSGIPQTKMTMYSFFDPMGVVPKTFWGKNMQTRPLVEATRNFFDKRIKIDELRRNEIKADLMMSIQPRFNPEEERKLQFATLLMNGFEKKKVRCREERSDKSMIKVLEATVVD